MYVNPKQFFNQNIFDIAIENAFYRKEIVTGPHSQVVIMCIPVGQEIGAEAHTVDQILIFVQGRGQAIINDVVSEVKEHHLVFVPAGTKHNFKNTGSDYLKLFTIYAPSEDAVGTLEEKKS
ncbi:MAG TPA: cupin domain-containing protein [Candidatus Babeliales bacterium]|jgi:mannose-6-phosphate isomerase-like protein (cupin superfamily)|nr:cupin domain-containing protein [Candidatus Babeliales bacterium]